VTKNPMEQVKLEFQMLRAKQNLISPNLTEQIRITAKNCPTLYREISKIAQNFKILTPEITISELEHYKTEYKHWIIRYDRSENKLIIGNNLLDQLTMPELRNLIASEIGYEICMVGNSNGWNFLKAIGLNLIFYIPATIISFILIYMGQNTLFTLLPILYIPYILLTPLMFSNFATKSVLQCNTVIQLISLVMLSLPMIISYFMLVPLTNLAIAIVILPITYLLYPICSWIAKSYAKSHIEIALNKLPYLPNAALLNSAINKIEANNKHKSQSKSILKSWCRHRRSFAENITKQSLKRQKLAAQAAAMDKLVGNDSELTGLEQSALASA
ncbi:MAG TPA: hypothetical protein VJJ81_03345, partial [Candidatus Babeliales bacterium]|nr:hypothetical protein [Candidatus Babeliales bacterium]